jgi:hypothetical protein
MLHRSKEKKLKKLPFANKFTKNISIGKKYYPSRMDGCVWLCESAAKGA